VIYLENPERARGLASSVRRALKSTRFMTPTVLLVPVDLVHLKRRDLERLVARARAHPRALVARRLHGGPATPLLLPAHLRPRALALEGDRGLGALFRESPPHGMELLDLHSAAADLDTPAQLRAARTLRALGAGRELRARHGRPAQVRGV
jgi:CTP:molybdopterin cytidylyltransferase MocA